jgi:hypothetical protein
VTGGPSARGCQPSRLAKQPSFKRQTVPVGRRKGDRGTVCEGLPALSASQTTFVQVYGLGETGLWREKIISGHHCGGGLGRYIRDRGHTPPGAVLLPLGDAWLFSAPIVVLMRHPRSDVVARCSLVRGAAELQHNHGADIEALR